MEAIILAGGFGTRLQGVVKDVPKPMADVAGRPFLEHLAARLVRSGTRRIILSVGYKREIIINHFGASFQGAEMVYSEEAEPLGTGGALRRALDMARGESVLVLNGDSFFDFDQKALYAFHKAEKCNMTMALKPMADFDRYGVVVVERGRVLGFKEKAPVKSGLINAGVYLMEKSMGALLAGYNAPFSFESDFLQKKCGEVDIAAFVGDGYFIDIGIPEDYARAQTQLKDAIGRDL